MTRNWRGRRSATARRDSSPSRWDLKLRSRRCALFWRGELMCQWTLCSPQAGLAQRSHRLRQSPCPQHYEEIERQEPYGLGYQITNVLIDLPGGARFRPTGEAAWPNYNGPLSRLAERGGFPTRDCVDPSAPLTVRMQTVLLHARNLRSTWGNSRPNAI